MNYAHGIEFAVAMLALWLFIAAIPTLIDITDFIEAWMADSKLRKAFLIGVPVSVAFLVGAFR